MSALQTESDRRVVGTVLAATASTIAFFNPYTFPFAVAAYLSGSAGVAIDFYKQVRIRDNIENIESLHAQRNRERVKTLAARSLPFLIELEPKSEKSKIDPRAIVSRFQWAVTLIFCNGSDGSHTSIIVEGLHNGKYDLKRKTLIGKVKVNVGEYFMYKTDFQNTNEIFAGVFKESELSYDRRTRLIKVSSDKVISMIANIKNQKRKCKYDPNYNLILRYTGPDDEHPDDHNCFTWAREHLKDADIVDLGTKTLYGLVSWRPKNYAEYGSGGLLTRVGLRLPSLNVSWNNISSEYDETMDSILYRESI